MKREEKIKGLIALIDYANEALEQEQNCSEIPTGSTTKTCRTCRNFGSHHGICEICKDNKCWTEKKPIERYHSRNLKAYADDMGVSVEQAEKELLTEKPTTKNDLAVEKIVDVLGSYTDLDIPYKHKIAEDILNNLPSVTPQEPRKGHWIDTNDKGFEYHRIYKCSNCEYTVCAYPEEIKRYKFCYGCGSRNEVEE